jgi:hypothetical protein
MPTQNTSSEFWPHLTAGVNKRRRIRWQEPGDYDGNGHEMPYPVYNRI